MSVSVSDKEHPTNQRGNEANRNSPIEPATEPKQRTCFLVVGMHRSGTSALTRVISLLGAALPRDLMGPAADNGLGFWEPQKLVEYNDRVLADLGSRWSDWQKIGLAESPRATEYAKELASLIEEQYADASPFVIKDPRVCRLVPLYETALAVHGAITHFLLPIRNPLAVIASLNARNAMSEGVAALLWLRHVLDSEYATRGKPRAIISYEALLTDWRGVVREVGDRLGSAWQPAVLDQAASEIDAFLSSEHQHHAPSLADLEGRTDVAAWIKAAYAAILVLERQPGDAAALTELDRVRCAFDEAAPAFAVALKGELDVHDQRLAAERAESTTEITGLREELAAHTSALEQAHGTISACDAELRNRALVVDRLTGELAEQKAAISVIEAEHVQLKTSLRDRETEVRSLQDERERLSLLITQLHARNADQERAWNERFARGMESVHRTYQTSASYRLAKPIRKIESMVGRATLRPLTDLITDGQEGHWTRWKMTGNDPAFLLEHANPGALPPGRYHLIIETSTAEAIHNALIYYDVGTGFSQNACQQLLFRAEGPSRARAEFALPSAAERLRFDPSDKQGMLTIGRVWLSRPTKFVRYARIAARIAYENRNDPRALGRGALTAARIFARSGFRGVAERLAIKSVSTPNRPARTDLPIANDQDREWISHLRQQATWPKMSALLFAGGGGAGRLGRAAQSLEAQLCALEEIIVWIPADAGSAVRSDLDEWARKNRNVRIFHEGSRFDGHFRPVDAILIMTSDVSLRPEATAAFGCELATGNGNLIYSDEAIVDDGGNVTSTFFKPKYSARLAGSSDYMGSCGVLRLGRTDLPTFVRDIVRRVADVGSVRRFLTIQASTQHPAHIARTPFVLFDDGASRKPVTLPAPASKTPPPMNKTVAILIPSRDRLGLLEPCIASILEHTDYPRELLEIVVIDNGSEKAETLDYFKSGEKKKLFSVARDDGNFNFARLNNFGARQTRADVYVFLNNDTLITQRDWLTRLVAAALEPGVGLVGAKLLYEDRTVQHGGVILGVQGVAAHADVNIEASAPGYHGLAFHDREVSAVTGACMATQAKHFWDAGGFDENLEVAFNDILLCIRMLELGLVNVQLNSVRVTHAESKSRGFDDTPRKREKFFKECVYAREKAGAYFLNDDYYSPNLSLQEAYKDAHFKRSRKPWRAPKLGVQPRLLILSCVHQQGYGVPVVIKEHAEHLLRGGFDVHIGGPTSCNDLVYAGCTRAVLNDPVEAMSYAIEQNIDIIVPHTPPFFSVARWTGPYPIVCGYDYGEPPPELFADAAARRDQLQEKKFAFTLMHRRYGISRSVRDESGFADMIVAPLGNSHMKHWSPDMRAIRERIRRERGWSDKVVVLNVCRFLKAERRYKGIDLYMAVAKEVGRTCSDVGVVCVQCGKGTDEDVAYVTAAGVACFVNVSEDEMSDLYCAADIYANFSQWEGWNLGIAQALSYGLPVIASDIPAHRINFADFGITISSEIATIAASIERHAKAVIQADFQPNRTPRIVDWAECIRPFAESIMEAWAQS